MLPTSVSTPERSPGVRKTLKVSSENQESISDTVVHRPSAGARKSLGMQFQENAAASEMIIENEDALLNIDDTMSHEQTTRVKVLILWPNGRTEVRVPGEKEDILLLKNVALKNWQAVANSILKHEQLKPEMLKALWQALKAEFRDYCSSNSVLEGRSPEELIAFSNNLVVEEIVLRCPFWSSCIGGACGVELKESCKLGDSVKNSVALATSATARVRNKSMSAIAYQVSSILFHIGVSHQDLIRLNRLGISMSPDMTLGLQRRLGKNFDSKVLSYKKALEDRPADTLALLMEIEEKQIAAIDDSEIEVLLDVSEEGIRDYEHFTPEAFSTATKMLQAEKEKKNSSVMSSNILKQVISDYKNFNFPFFK